MNRVLMSSCALMALSVLGQACLERPVAGVTPVVQSSGWFNLRDNALEKVDLLLVVDNSGSMRDNQSNIMAQFGPLIDLLVNPPCISRANPQAPAHQCVTNNADDVPTYPAVKDLHVGVVSSDLGTPGSTVPGCDDSDRGDDGLLNPIRNGPALQSHLPWAPRRPNAETAPPGFRPAVCNNDPNQFPSFITFCSNAADASCDVVGMNASSRMPALFADWFKCNAGLFVNGCGLESQLEAMWRALVEKDPHAVPGNTSPNARFIRDDALLAIIQLTDEEDGSVRNCAHDLGFSAQTGAACNDATQVYNTASMQWSHATNPDLRFYLYTPGDSRDPTWSLDRYYNTAPSTVNHRWGRDLLSLKPGHPERIVFAAIAGVPLTIPTQPNPTAVLEPLTDWDQLLGTVGPSGNTNDFTGRNADTAIDGTQASAGPFSMRQANRDPNCSHVVPACRREGSTYDPMRTCSSTAAAGGQYMAFPSRRVVELARRFDEFPACNGQPCRNGLVTSICSNDFSAAMRQIVSKIQSRLPGQCLPRALQISPDSQGNDTVQCLVREFLPEGSTMCDATRGRTVPENEADRTFTDAAGVTHTVCDIAQVPTVPPSGPDAMRLRPANTAHGWYYDRTMDPADRTCTQRISFTQNAGPGVGAQVQLECVQAVNGSR